ncbi:hypothetical protein [Methylocapsa sp. S129]|nr:hypothetical protein [Methylocapsa sp. S129]
MLDGRRLARMVRDAPLAEDWTQEALLAAIEPWLVTGLRKNLAPD